MGVGGKRGLGFVTTHRRFFFIYYFFLELNQNREKENVDLVEGVNTPGSDPDADGSDALGNGSKYGFGPGPT